MPGSASLQVPAVQEDLRTQFLCCNNEELKTLLLSQVLAVRPTIGFSGFLTLL